MSEKKKGHHASLTSFATACGLRLGNVHLWPASSKRMDCKTCRRVLDIQWRDRRKNFQAKAEAR